mmetsp:Transcript_20419/g.60781  ORF Transcript_20419/g.60781 Transcript_20419/m.60781 type:complete len:260 (-) Transcript_20419:464-1243(-)
MPSSAARCSVRLISRSMRSMVSAPIWLSMTSGWNWLKLEMEKKTDTTLMHRSMLFFMSSRIMRASVCTSVSCCRSSSKFSVLRKSCAIMPVARTFFAISSSYRSSMYSSSLLRYAWSYCFICALKMCDACICWCTRTSSASCLSAWRNERGGGARCGEPPGDAGLCACPLACSPPPPLCIGEGPGERPPPERCCRPYRMSSTWPTLDGWMSLHFSWISLASMGTLVLSLSDLTDIFLVAASRLTTFCSPSPPTAISCTS